MDEEDRVDRNKRERMSRQSRSKPYERPPPLKQKDGLLQRISGVFASVPFWLKEKLSPAKVTNGVESMERDSVDAGHANQQSSTAGPSDNARPPRDTISARRDVFHTPPSAVQNEEMEEQGDSDGDDNGSTSTSACSSVIGDGELQDSRVSTLAVPLNSSLQSAILPRPRLSFKTLNLTRRRMNDPNESAESSINVSRSPSLYTEDSERGSLSLNVGTKRVRLNLSTATLPGMSRDSSPFSRLSKDEMFQSSFYPGKTTYGGASAYRFDSSRPFRTHVISVKSRVKPADKPKPMTATTKRIYEALESLAPPPGLDTPKKQISTPSASTSMTGLFTGFSKTPKPAGPPVKPLQTPRPARVVFPPLKVAKEQPKPVEQAPSIPKAPPVVTPASSLKMVSKVTEHGRRRLGEKAERKRLVAEEEEEDNDIPDLPQISLPAVSLKPISLGVSFSPPQPTPASEFTFAPGKTVGTGKITSENVSFVFATGVEPLAPAFVAPSLVPKNGAKWECPACMVRNDVDKKVCPCCSTPKPGDKPAMKLTPEVPKNGGKWTCSSCWVSNDSDKSKCACCQASKPEAKAAPEKPGALWSCKECLTSHDKDSSVCPACKAPKEQAKVLPSAAPRSILDMFKPKPGSWRCTTCDVSNDADKSKCCSCSAPRSEPASQNLPPLSAMDSLKPKVGTWSCAECFVSNKADSLTCCACSTPKPGAPPAKTAISDMFKPAVTSGEGSTGAVNLSELFKPKPGSWKCSVCDVSNDASKSACAACATAKPGAEKSNSGFGSVKFGAVPEKTESSGFQFGIPASQPVSSVTTGFKFGESKPADATSKFSFGVPPSSANSTVAAGGKRKADGGAAEDQVTVTAVSDSNANIVKKTVLKRPDHPLGTETGTDAKKLEVSPVRLPASNQQAFGGFSFGAKPKAEEPEARKTEAAQAVFSFGTAAPAAETKVTPTVTFGPVDSQPSKNVEAKPATVATFGGFVAPSTSAPLFQFGAGSQTTPVKVDATENKSNLFAFGTPLTDVKSSQGAPEPSKAFSFGAPSKSESSPFAFGAAPVSTTPSLFGAAPAATSSSFAPSTFGTSAASTTASATFGTNAATTSAPSSLFGMSIPATTATPLFGAPAASTTTSTFGGFGATTTVASPFAFGSSSSTFGAATTTAAPAFGASSSAPATTFGTGSMFGTGASQQPAFAFGSSSTTAPTFGSTTTTQSSSFGGFGSTTAAAPTFGGFGTTSAPATSAPAFGGFGTATTTQSSLFGMPAPAFGSSSTFGATPSASTQSVFGTSQPAPAFGGAQAPTTFGSQTAPAFGAAPSQTPSFGAVSSQAPAFGTAASTNQGFNFQAPAATGMSFSFGGPQQSQPVFGASATPAFGGSSTAAPSFGSSSTPSPSFGAPPAQSAPAFGGTSQPATNQAFSSTPSFNFGQSGPVFQAQPPAFSFGATPGAPAASANPFDASANPRGSAQSRVIRKANRRIQRS